MNNKSRAILGSHKILTISEKSFGRSKRAESLRELMSEHKSEIAKKNQRRPGGGHRE